VRFAHANGSLFLSPDSRPVLACAAAVCWQSLFFSTEGLEEKGECARRNAAVDDPAMHEPSLGAENCQAGPIRPRAYR